MVSDIQFIQLRLLVLSKIHNQTTHLPLDLRVITGYDLLNPTEFKDHITSLSLGFCTPDFVTFPTKDTLSMCFGIYTEGSPESS